MIVIYVFPRRLKHALYRRKVGLATDVVRWLNSNSLTATDVLRWLGETNKQWLDDGIIKWRCAALRLSDFIGTVDACGTRWKLVGRGGTCETPLAT